MIKYIIVLMLLVIGCGGGQTKHAHTISIGSLIPVSQTAPTNYRTNSLMNKYLARPFYNSNTGQVEQLNPMPTFGDGQRPNYMNYETGEVYVPVPGPGNSWMNFDGDIIQP